MSQTTSPTDVIRLDGVETHNLKKIDVRIPHRAYTIISGVSGSGKSSLAFDTLFAEGQRRFVESLSTYARQFLQRMEKPPVERVRNILPAVALRQSNAVTNARSTLATLTELSDHLSLIFAHIGTTTCPDCQKVVTRDTPESIVEALGALPEGARLVFVAEVRVLDVQTPQFVLERLAAEGHQRLWLDGAPVQLADAALESLLAMTCFPVLVDRVKVSRDGVMRLREAAEHGLRLGEGRLRVIDVSDKEAFVERSFRDDFACNGCGRAFIAPIAPLFSFNSPIGACPECSGFGRAAGIDPDKVVPDGRLSLERGAVAPFETPKRAAQKRKLLQKARERGVPTDIPFQKLAPEDRKFVFEGHGRYKAVRGFFDRLQARRHKPQARILIARYRGYTTCPSCEGARLSADARAVTVGQLPLSRFYAMRVCEALDAFRALDLTEGERKRVAPLLDEVLSRLIYLQQVGLGYLHLDRQSRTLSGGEVQRIQLTSSLGRTLTDTLYVLDEPTAGLHARDTLKLLEVIERLRDMGNAVVVVEHDPDMIQSADWVIELGPRGGEQGGQLIYQGPIGGLSDADTPTAAALRRRGPTLATLDGPRGFNPDDDPCLAIVEASEHNLKDITVQIPLARLTCVTGVSGSGKTTLVRRCLFDTWRRTQGHTGVEPARVDHLEGFSTLQDVVLMEQGGLGRSSRSNVASYTGAWEPIRKTYGGLTTSKREGLSAGHFSFNRPGGRCEPCEGTGRIVVEMHFMADIEVVCEACEGRRFTDKVLAARFRGLNIAQILDLTVEEAITFFEGHLAVTRRLTPLTEVGLGYLRLGQTTSTLSGGEAQRLLLASHLGQKRPLDKDGILFIFDEPTIGLHLHDIGVLVGALRRAVSEGHTVLVVEHNIDFIAQADHVIDLGPDGGPDGGDVVAQGTPAEIAASPRSLTGHFLGQILG